MKKKKKLTNNHERIKNAHRATENQVLASGSRKKHNVFSTKGVIIMRIKSSALGGDRGPQDAADPLGDAPDNATLISVLCGYTTGRFSF